MPISNYKLRSSDWEGKRIADLSDRPSDSSVDGGNGYSADMVKACFDYIPINVLGEQKLNGLIDYLLTGYFAYEFPMDNAMGESSNLADVIAEKIASSDIKHFRLGEDDVLEYSTDGETWVQAGVKSVYEVAIEGGFVGSESDFFARLGSLSGFATQSSIQQAQSDILDLETAVCVNVQAIEQIESNIQTIEGDVGDVQDDITSMEDAILALKGENYISSESVHGNATAISALQTAKANKSTVTTATLLLDNWVGDSAPYEYTLALEGVTTSTNQEILPPIDMTVAQAEALQSAMIIDGGQNNGEIILKAYGELPDFDIPIRIIKRGD